MPETAMLLFEPSFPLLAISFLFSHSFLHSSDKYRLKATCSGSVPAIASSVYKARPCLHSVFILVGGDAQTDMGQLVPQTPFVYDAD